MIINYTFSSQYIYPVIGSMVSKIQRTLVSLARFKLILQTLAFRSRHGFFPERGTLVTGLACFSHTSTCATRVSAYARKRRPLKRVLALRMCLHGFSKQTTCNCVNHMSINHGSNHSLVSLLSLRLYNRFGLAY